MEHLTYFTLELRLPPGAEVFFACFKEASGPPRPRFQECHTTPGVAGVGRAAGATTAGGAGGGVGCSGRGPEPRELSLPGVGARSREPPLLVSAGVRSPAADGLHLVICLEAAKARSCGASKIAYEVRPGERPSTSAPSAPAVSSRMGDDGQSGESWCELTRNCFRLPSPTSSSPPLTLKLRYL